MPEQTPPLDTVVSAVHDALARPGVRSRLTERGACTIEFTETALVAFIADQRATAWQAALATTQHSEPPTPDEHEGEAVGTGTERAIVDLLQEGPRPRGEIDDAITRNQGCSRATVSRALDALARRGTVVALPARKGWCLTTAFPALDLLIRARAAITADGDTRMHNEALATALEMPMEEMKKQLYDAGVSPLRRAFTRGGRELRGYDLADIDTAIATHTQADTR
ncbi:hypothetical protein ACWFMI_27365 [Nocardiopsis terrae]